MLQELTQERLIDAKLRVPRPRYWVLRTEDILPVGVHGRRGLRVWSVEVGVEEVDDRLTDHSLKLPRKEVVVRYLCMCTVCALCMCECVYSVHVCVCMCMYVCRCVPCIGAREGIHVNRRSRSHNERK